MNVIVVPLGLAVLLIVLHYYLMNRLVIFVVKPILRLNVSPDLLLPNHKPYDVIQLELVSMHVYDDVCLRFLVDLSLHQMLRHPVDGKFECFSLKRSYMNDTYDVENYCFRICNWFHLFIMWTITFFFDSRLRCIFFTALKEYKFPVKNKCYWKESHFTSVLMLSNLHYFSMQLNRFCCAVEIQALKICEIEHSFLYNLDISLKKMKYFTWWKILLHATIYTWNLFYKVDLVYCIYLFY